MLKELQNIYRALPVEDHARRALVETLMATAAREERKIADVLWRMRNAALIDAEQDAMSELALMVMPQQPVGFEASLPKESVLNAAPDMTYSIGWHHIPAQKGV